MNTLLMKRLNKFIIPLLFLAALYILIFQAQWLGIIVIKNPLVPLGTFISWALILLFSLFMFQNIALTHDVLFERILKTILIANLIMAVLWGFVSFFLSGNWTFNFQNMTGFKIWIIYTAVIFLLPAGVVLSRQIRKIRKGKSGI
jgi:hypothetical protein